MNRSEQSMLGRLSRCGLTAVLLASALTSACTSSRQSTVQPTPSFVFRSLDLSQRAEDGNRDWDLTSPEARYDLSSRTIRARRPQGILYREDQPHYRVTADLATVLRDGDLVVLEGSVQLRQLNQRGLIIAGDSLIWTPSQSRMVINQRPTAQDGQTQLRSRELTFQQDQERLGFNGATQLNRRDDDRTDSTIVRGGSGTWNLRTGLLQAQGPLEAIRTDGRTLTASGLNGNTRKGYLDLQKPVTLLLENDRGTINAGRTRWLFFTQQLQSEQPVQANFRMPVWKARASSLTSAAARSSSPVHVALNKRARLLQPDVAVGTGSTNVW